MGKHTFKEWMIAVRAWSFPASAMPVIVSTAYVYWKFRNGAGAVDGFVLWPAIPVSLITVTILHANNTHDTATDIRSHIRTIPIAFGPRTARAIYYKDFSRERNASPRQPAMSRLFIPFCP